MEDIFLPAIRQSIPVIRRAAANVVLEIDPRTPALGLPRRDLQQASAIEFSIHARFGGVEKSRQDVAKFHGFRAHRSALSRSPAPARRRSHRMAAAEKPEENPVAPIYPDRSRRRLLLR